MNRFFVTGTDTDIGKTFVSTILAWGLCARYWKPIQTGTSDGKDKDFVSSWISREQIVDEAYVFSEPLSPHLASAHEGRPIDLDYISSLYKRLDGPLIIEGAGGVMVPINTNRLMLDLIKAVNLPAIVVSSTRLGTINHTLLTLEALRSKNIPVLGVITNGKECRETSESIECYGSVRLLGHIPHLPELTIIELDSAFERLNLKGPT